MQAIITVIMESSLFDYTLWTNTAQQFYNEWKGHNDLYILGYNRESTEHVDYRAGDGYEIKWDWWSE